MVSAPRGSWRGQQTNSAKVPWLTSRVNPVASKPRGKLGQLNQARAFRRKVVVLEIVLVMMMIIIIVTEPLPVPTALATRHHARINEI